MTKLKNKLIVAAAGSGKTTHLVKQALGISSENILITTFTEANQQEICKKFIQEKGHIPPNVIIQTWFSFLIEHGLRPFQGGVFEGKVNGISLVGGQSTRYVKESEVERYYFDQDKRVYSDKLSKLVLLCDQKHNGKVISRISAIFPYIFIDEIQDIAAYDLDVVVRLIESPSQLLLVGDPRQATYATNNAPRHKKFRKSKVVDFFDEKVGEMIEIDRDSLVINYRSNEKICAFADKLFPDLPPCKSGQDSVTGHDGVFLVREADVDKYLHKFPDCVQLRYNVKEKRIRNTRVAMNIGNSKGLTFNRTLIYPTTPMCEWLKKNESELAEKSRSDFYVALTRAKFSVGIVYDYHADEKLDGLFKY